MLGISALEHGRLAGHGQCQSMDERFKANVPVQWRGLELTIDRSEGEPIFDFGSTDLRVKAQRDGRALLRKEIEDHGVQ